MTSIYYFSTIIFIWVELLWIMSPIEKTLEAKQFAELSKENKGKKWDDFSSEYKTEIKKKLGLLYIVIWMLIGLFTVQWVAFLAILIFNFGIINPLSKIKKYSMFYTVIHWLNSIIGFAFAVFVIINHYHLHIDLTELFFRLF